MELTFTYFGTHVAKNVLAERMLWLCRTPALQPSNPRPVAMHYKTQHIVKLSPTKQRESARARERERERESERESARERERESDRVALLSNSY